MRLGENNSGCSRATVKPGNAERKDGGQEGIQRVSTFTRELIKAMKDDDLINGATANSLMQGKPIDSGVIKLVPDLRPKDTSRMYEEYIKLALGAVRMDGMVLENYPGLWDNKEIVIAAVKQNGEAFAFASDRLKDDEDVFIAAVTKDRNSNIYGSRRLRMKYSFLEG